MTDREFESLLDEYVEKAIELHVDWMNKADTASTAYERDDARKKVIDRHSDLVQWADEVDLFMRLRLARGRSKDKEMQDLVVALMDALPDDDEDENVPRLIRRWKPVGSPPKQRGIAYVLGHGRIPGHSKPQQHQFVFFSGKMSHLFAPKRWKPTHYRPLIPGPK